ncbi:putative histone acetyltransferase [Helianthus debilis subsp. tardiflorus]
MNLQAPIAGQYSRQVSNQGGASLPAIPVPQQQNMMQKSEGGPRAPVTMEHARQFIRDRIYKFLTQRLIWEVPPKNYLDIVRRLEEGLFKSAQSKEEHLNLDTLENRLQALFKRYSMNNQNQQYQQQSNANASMGTMIPAPGFPQNGNSGNMMSSVVNQGSFSMTTPGPSRSMHNGSFDGGLSDGSQ